MIILILGEKPHLCNVCNKSFRTKYNLSGHMGIHTGEKLHSKAIIRRMIILILGLRPYSCDVCNKKFLRKNDLSRHTKIHAGEWLH